MITEVNVYHKNTNYNTSRNQPIPWKCQVRSDLKHEVTDKQEPVEFHSFYVFRKGIKQTKRVTDDI